MFNFHHHFHCQCSVHTELLHVINILLRYLWLTMYYLGYVVSIYTVNVYLHVENAVKLKNTAYTCMFLIIDQYTQLCVSSQESHVAYKCVFTGTANLPFLIPCISITIGVISIKFTYFMPSIYMTLHIKFKGNWASSLRLVCS